METFIRSGGSSSVRANGQGRATLFQLAECSASELNGRRKLLHKCIQSGI